MKKHIVYIVVLCLLALIFAGCSDAQKPAVVTPATSSQESTTDTPTTAEPTSEAPTTEPPSEQETESQGQTAYEQVYAAATTHRDGVGNIWLNVIVAYENTGSEPLYLDYSTIAVYSGGEEVIRLDSVVAYPQVIEPGQIGYYFEEKQVDFAENDTLTLQMEPRINATTAREHFPIDDVQLRDAAFGVEVHGMFEVPAQVSGLVCVSAILFDLEGNPITVLYDYVDASATDFVLSSDKLPEDVSIEDISSCIAFAYLYEG